MQNWYEYITVHPYMLLTFVLCEQIWQYISKIYLLQDAPGCNSLKILWTDSDFEPEK
jgi:hypothetical protein